jgi:hypothetical protein
LRERGSYDLQDIVARVVAVSVINPFEAVDVDEQQSGCLAIASATIYLRSRRFFERAPVAKAGEASTPCTSSEVDSPRSAAQ